MKSACSEDFIIVLTFDLWPSRSWVDWGVIFCFHIKMKIFPVLAVTITCLDFWNSIWHHAIFNNENVFYKKYLDNFWQKYLHNFWQKYLKHFLDKFWQKIFGSFLQKCFWQKYLHNFWQKYLIICTIFDNNIWIFFIKIFGYFLQKYFNKF